MKHDFETKSADRAFHLQKTVVEENIKHREQHLQAAQPLAHMILQKDLTVDEYQQLLTSSYLTLKSNHTTTDEQLFRTLAYSSMGRNRRENNDPPPYRKGD